MAIHWPAEAEAAVTLSFDDGYAATYEATVHALHQRNLCGTYHIVTGRAGAPMGGPATSDWSEWREAVVLGHEVGSHGMYHTALAGPLSDARRLLTNVCAAPDRGAYARQMWATARALRRWQASSPGKEFQSPLTGESRPLRNRGTATAGGAPAPRRRDDGGIPRYPDGALALIPMQSRPSSPAAVPRERGITSDLAASRRRISEELGSAAESFAYPAGRHSTAARRAVATAGFRSARTLDLGLNQAWNSSAHGKPAESRLREPSNLLALRAVAMGPGMSVEEMVAWFDRARAGRAWLIAVFHLVAEMNKSQYPYFCTVSDWQRMLDALQRRPLWVGTQEQVVRYLTGGGMENRFAGA